MNAKRKAKQKDDEGRRSMELKELTRRTLRLFCISGVSELGLKAIERIKAENDADMAAENQERE